MGNNGQSKFRGCLKFMLLLNVIINVTTPSQSVADMFFVAYFISEYIW